jgi:hypothetical protein
MAESCCCGNVLRDTFIRIVVSPCKCPEPGPGPSTHSIEWLPDDVPRKQYEERKRIGLPVLTDAEKAAYGKEWR